MEKQKVDEGEKLGGSAASLGTLDHRAENSEEKKQLALGYILEIRLMD